MTAFKSLMKALLKGFVRDRQAVFFTILFPLMFLVLFGGVFAGQTTSRIALIEVGQVRAFDDLPEGAAEAFEQAYSVRHETDLEEAVKQVRKGDAGVAVEQRGQEVIVHYSQVDPVKSAVAVGTLRSFVDAANVAASGQPPALDYRVDRVEDESLEMIQFVTPGLLGWAVATSATFGAAATLVGWRSTKLLRRLRLAPVSTASVVGARVGVTMLIAIAQTVIFVGLAMAAFGLSSTVPGGWPFR